MNSRIEIPHLRSFLESRGWSISDEGPKFLKYLAPNDLGFSEPYILNIPVVSGYYDYPLIIERIISNLGELYSATPDDIATAIQSRDTIFSLRLEGENSRDGSFPFLDFEAVVKSISETIENTGNFIISNSPFIETRSLLVDKFMKGCRFRQTEKGSFIVKIQMPSDMFIKEPDLFDEDGIKSEAISDRLVKIIDFINTRVFIADPGIQTPEFLAESFQLVSVDTFKKVESLLANSKVDKIEMRFMDTMRDKTICVEEFQTKKITHLHSYISHLETTLKDSIPIDCTGRIIEMKSKDPNGDKNFITIAGNVEGQIRKISVSLSNSDYQDAIDAHRNNKDVTIRGVARRLKTQFRIERLTNIIVHQ